MVNVNYNIDVTGKIVKFLTKEDILRKDDLMRAIYDENTTYNPSDLDIYLFRKVSEFIPAFIDNKIKDYKYNNLYEFIRILDNDEEFNEFKETLILF